MKHTFCICHHCGNVAAMIHDAGVPIHCCGGKMQRLEPGRSGAAGEKHIPVYRREGDTIHVTVGGKEHPMTEEHSIGWICLASERVIQYAHLRPKDEPRATFALTKGDEVREVFAFCNQHALWQH